MHPIFANKKLYVSGVSYAGHYVPGVADYIIRKNNTKMKFDAFSLTALD